MKCPSSSLLVEILLVEIKIERPMGLSKIKGLCDVSPADNWQRSVRIRIRHATRETAADFVGMITDNQLDSLATGLGLLMMALIMVHQ
jgi:Oligosaccaryltransferase